MGAQYLLFHCTYTIPVAALLTIFYYPFFTSRDICKIAFLNILAVAATIPWDSYLIRHGIWSYPPDATFNRALYNIPLEEVAFFVLQTSITGMVYCICSKALVLPMYLPVQPVRRARNLGGLGLVASFAIGMICFVSGGGGTYLGLILIWALPVVFLQWMLVAPFILSLPWNVTTFPIVFPTVYLWVADRSAMAAGVWSIAPATQLGVHVFGLEIEEMLFFLVTNVMIVFGLVGFDYACAMADYTTICTGDAPGTTRDAVKDVLQAMIRPPAIHASAITDLQQAVARLHEKSQSMFVGSALFQGPVRVDLIYVYSFCRVIDDLIDEAEDAGEAQFWIAECQRCLDARIRPKEQARWASPKPPYDQTKQALLHRAIAILPLSRMTTQPLYDLLKGFEMDLAFTAQSTEKSTEKDRVISPIATEHDLDRYATHVASTVAELVLDLLHHHYNQSQLYNHIAMARAGREMGKALQCVNIARDIHRDAAIGRVYIPTTWLAEAGLTPADILVDPRSPAAYAMQARLLDKAEGLYGRARGAIEELPAGVRGPVRTTVESYMEIGRYLRERRGESLRTARKMRLPVGRRLRVAWLGML
ncbi:terpenoid synthase [Aspergillus brunneoviolaceus CBS 621.78]|uniref:Terpenoid synthase n=1 Tax=Aspergillus brunneoviolaceus CBS 621.78 TaxID=1450534 RepID=A0ACD1GEZ6_9EURO|nr:terpenoid synthase [Aspergillus brunneoviolaceus CBS 621.78]RAH47802.1 terpenoid synthase [Aspergillus brunneoviolaceus CBS 621.78]